MPRLQLLQKRRRRMHALRRRRQRQKRGLPRPLHMHALRRRKKRLRRGPDSPLKGFDCRVVTERPSCRRLHQHQSSAKTARGHASSSPVLGVQVPLSDSNLLNPTSLETCTQRLKHRWFLPLAWWSRLFLARICEPKTMGLSINRCRPLCNRNQKRHLRDARPDHCRHLRVGRLRHSRTHLGRETSPSLRFDHLHSQKKMRNIMSRCGGQDS